MTEYRSLMAVALVALTGWLLYLLAPVLTPFLIAAVLAYMFNPLVLRLERWRLPRVLAVIVVFVLILSLVVGLVAILVPMVERQVSGFVARLPGYLDWAQTKLLPLLKDWQALIPALDPDNLKQALLDHWKEIGRWVSGAAADLTRSGLGLFGWLVSLVLVPIVMFYLLLDWERIVQNVRGLFPPSMRSRVAQLARETDEVLGSFLRGQLSVMASLATIYSLGLWLVGLHLALPIGLAAGLVSFVPYLGFITGVVAAGIAAWLQFQDPMMVVWVVAVFLSGQLLDALFLTPRLVGGRIGIHPVVVIFAIMAGGTLFGFFGVLLALPVAAVLKVWLRQVHGYYIKSPRPVRRRR
ncbi:MAG: AI-2E family transporter [Pseudomonadota bacterium]